MCGFTVFMVASNMGIWRYMICRKWMCRYLNRQNFECQCTLLNIEGIKKPARPFGLRAWCTLLYLCESTIGGCGRSRTAVDGFAGHCITVLLRSHKGEIKKPQLIAAFLFRIWSGKRGSNSRPQPWQGCALPLSYSRSLMGLHFTEKLKGVNSFFLC